jgi:hypothetical protein
MMPPVFVLGLFLAISQRKNRDLELSLATLTFRVTSRQSLRFLSHFELALTICLCPLFVVLLHDYSAYEFTILVKS